MSTSSDNEKSPSDNEESKAPPDTSKKNHKIDLATAFLMTLFPPVQIYQRIFNMNGSLDKPCLLLFQLPILSVVPAIMMATGNVESGNGGKPYDIWMYFPPALYILGMIFTLMYNKNATAEGKKENKMMLWLGLMIQFILPIIGGFFVFYFARHKKLCDKSSFKDSFNKVLFNSLFTHGCAILATKGIGMIPGYDIIIEKLSKIKYIGSIIDGGLYYVMYITIYTIINMMNGYYEVEVYCENKDPLLEIIRMSGAIVGGFGIGYGFYKNYKMLLQ